MPRRVVVLGPTGSGKSDVAMAAAASGGVEIIAVDAMQVYRGMDIGTAKPSPADQAAVRHHGLDLVDPSQPFSVADYQRAARAALADIDRAGRHALLVAGTGLYLAAVVDGLTLPGEWPDIRAALDAELAAGTPVADLFDRLRVLDPLAASRMEPTNQRRVVRALEVCLGSGRPFSSFGPGIADAQHRPVRDAGPPRDEEERFVQIGLRWPRPILRERIATRVGRMIAAGLVDEVRTLRSHPDGLSRTAAQALGYKELFAYLDGHVTLAAAVDDIVMRTQQYAVRQERWFRRDPRIRWIDVTVDPVAEVVPSVLELLA